jgi:2-(1,2-epoxy-1,2-dihydrophenyl)acetyl-CoA isomerase
MDDAETLVRGLYRALADGDRDGVRAALSSGFCAQFAEGMPVGGGRADGPEDALEHWWAIGRAYRVRAEPEEVLRDGDRVVVRGTYRGTVRRSGDDVKAAFVHLWTVGDGRLEALDQITDTVGWGQP